ncbi:MAG: excinuclease ABC subunit UvrB [Clostridia bacterium]|nr:excinuclease ABC subunit UvrB [Clostridia bacterium]
MEDKKFELVSNYKPTGDQPQAIQQLTQGILDGLHSQVLLGVTGSGKTFTMANIIANVNRPTLVLAHNKTLAAQLCNEFREFFPHNRVEFFVSYYDYYQPEAYIPSSDTYIEKDMSINDEIDKLRHSATCSLFERRDTLVVASVSCIYGLGSPESYSTMSLSLREGDEVDMREVIKKLIAMRYERNDIDFKRSTFRIKGDILDIFPAKTSEVAIRVEFFGDTIESISEFDTITNKKINSLKHLYLLPATHFAIERAELLKCLLQIQNDMEQQVASFEQEGKLIEAQRIKERVTHDIEMMREMGYCNGIENYSRYFDGRNPGEPPFVLLDYFPDDFIMFVDESHMTIPQVRAMYKGDLARKTNLVEYGFRLPSAFDNRPLKFDEFNERIPQVIYVSATPAQYELQQSSQVVEQIIRPTGLLDPMVEVRKIDGQIDDLMGEINKIVEKNGRVLVTTLTKKMAENLTTFFAEHEIKVKYLHSDIDTLERVQIINELRTGQFDVLVGINLLREGLDIPEVMLVAILDADKEGFLRNESSLIQTIGRAARNAEAKVIMYADVITDSMKRAIDVTERRRKIQDDYNKAYNFTPKTIIKDIKNTLLITEKVKPEHKSLKQKEILNEMDRLKGLMSVASKNLDFERAIVLREEISELKKLLKKE